MFYRNIICGFYLITNKMLYISSNYVRGAPVTYNIPTDWVLSLLILVITCCREGVPKQGRNYLFFQLHLHSRVESMVHELDYSSFPLRQIIPGSDSISFLLVLFSSTVLFFSVGMPLLSSPDTTLL